MVLAKMNELARKYGYLGGKWIMYLPMSKAQAIWQEAITRLQDGVLQQVRYIKIDTVDNRAENIYHKDETKICFVTQYYTNYHQIMQVAWHSNMQLAKNLKIHFHFQALDEIRAFSKNYDMLYKADICSHLEIFANNKYGIRPSLLKSKGTVSI